MFFQRRRVRFGAGVADNRLGDLGPGRPPDMGCGAGGCTSPLVIFQIFTNFDALAGLATVGCWLGAAQTVLAGVLIGLGSAASIRCCSYARCCCWASGPVA